MRTKLILLALISPLISLAQNGLDFDGTNDFVQTTYSGVSGNGARTVEAWIKTTANADPNGGGSQKVITDWGTQTTGGRFTFCVLWNNAIRLEVNGNGISGVIPVNDGNWHHVAAVYNPAAASTVELYVDGALDVSGTPTVTVNTGSSVQMRIGQRIDGVNHFMGTIDEVRVWNTAKNATELQQNMNSELCTFPADLQAYYTFNHGTAGGSNPTQFFLNDFSAGGNDGVLNNFALNGATSNWVTGAILGQGFTTSTNAQVACEQYTWPANGQTYTSGGTFTTTLTGVLGCDSIATLNLTISSPNDLSNNVTTCDSYTWSVSGQTYTADTYIDTLLYNSYGCPYQHVLNLTINESYDTTYNVSACSPYVWNVNGQSYTIPGFFTETYTGVNGCDSLVHLNLFLWSDATATITDNGDGTLTANGGSEYQWLDCNNNYAEIMGETGSTFTPTANGSYAVVVSEFGQLCPDTSDCFMVTNVGINDLGLPVKEKILVKITDLMGRETEPTSNTPLLYIYSDGTIERVFKLK